MRLRNMLLLLAALATSAAIVGIASCSKSERDEDLETLSARDYALAHHIFDDAFRQVHKVAMGDTLLNDTTITQQKFDGCLDRRYTFLSDTVAIFPMYLQLSYKSGGVTCSDSAIRHGILRANFTGKYLNQGTVITITFEHYAKDKYDVDGTVTIVNGGVNEEGRRTYVMTVTEGLITANNVHIDFDGSFVYEWVAGSTTDTDFDDDVFEIVEGIVTARNSRGGSFVNEITAPYTSDLTCPHFVTGRSDMEVENLTPRKLNYGELGDCDNIVVSRRNNTYLDVEIPIMQP